MQENDVSLIRADFCNPRGKLPQRDIDGGGEMTRSIFIRTSDIDDKGSVTKVCLGDIRRDQGHLTKNEKSGEDRDNYKKSGPVH
jgi:hypothetical protein